MATLRGCRPITVKECVVHTTTDTTDVQRNDPSLVSDVWNGHDILPDQPHDYAGESCAAPVVYGDGRYCRGCGERTEDCGCDAETPESP